MITEEQRKERINYIGASEAAAVLGLSRWKTPLEVWALKTGTVQEEDISGKLAIEVGNELEDLGARLFEKRTGKKVHRVNETVYHPNYPFIAANLDRRVVGEDALLEIKTAGAWAAKSWEGEEVPQEVIIQVLHQLAVTGKSVGYACCLIGGNQSFVWKRIERDPVLIAEIIRKEVEFWVKFIEPKVFPTTITKNDADILFKLFPNAPTGSEVVLGDEANQLAESLEGLRSDLANLEGIIDKEKNALRAMLGDSELGTTGRYRISWKNQETTRLDTDKLRAQHPDIFAEFSKKTPSRVLRINKIKAPQEKK